MLFVIVLLEVERLEEVLLFYGGADRGSETVNGLFVFIETQIRVWGKLDCTFAIQYRT